MEKDKAIEDLFLAQKPTFDDSAEFMAKLTKRLEAVEIVKQYQERTLHRYKMMMVAAFVVGIICPTTKSVPGCIFFPSIETFIFAGKVFTS